MNNTEQALTIIVVMLIGVTILNFWGDYVFIEKQRAINEAQFTIYDHLIELQSNTIILTDALSTVVLNLNEKMDLVLDELFDRVWEDLEQS